MGKRKIKPKQSRSQLYTFATSLRSRSRERERSSSIKCEVEEGGGGDSGGGHGGRTVQCNRLDDEPVTFCYCNNHVSTTKYTSMSFFPKALYEQFRRVANLYFLGAAIISVTPISPIGPASMVFPLLFVVGVSMAKEWLEDWRRNKQDIEVNNRHTLVHVGGGVFSAKPWEAVAVGDIVRVDKDLFFPADMLLISSAYEDGICYVETMNLDGETNLKVKRSLEATLDVDEDEDFKDFSGTIRCEDPNPSLYTFVGNLQYGNQVYSLEPSHVLLRDSKLRNTAYVYGAVIFTGHESKVMQNTTDSPAKRSSLEKRLDSVIYMLFLLLLLISVISSISSGVETKFNVPTYWYLQPDDPNIQAEYNPRNVMLAILYHLLIALMLYGYLIPISLYVSIEVVKLLQATFINRDLHLFDEDTGKPAAARTSNLNEELGQVDTILSDKTGTLTCNQMDFLKCSIAGTSYGVRASEVELAAAKQMASAEIDELGSELNVAVDMMEGTSPAPSQSPGLAIKGFSFEDPRLQHGNWQKEPNADVISLFCRILAVCHTAIPEWNEDSKSFVYEAESPDEGAFLIAAREFGFMFYKRTQSSVFVRERYGHGKDDGEPVEKEFKILNMLDFTSKRKRMTVIVRDESGKIILMCKGADTIIFDRLSDNGKTYLDSTTKHLNKYGESGLRTLALSYRMLQEREYQTWNEEFVKAKTCIGSEREEMLETVSDMIEKELNLVGATAVEDKLQRGVPECIDKLAQAGLKIWVLTGDKMETAINIGFACSLLREGMKQFCIQVNEDDGSTGSTKDKVLWQINNNTNEIKLQSNQQHAAFALIIDGKTLAYALEDDMKHHFLELAVLCASVICCRVSPKQKALVTRLVKEGTGRITLGIGDGANDVGMIQEADIGIGISGVEGMQAVMASDFAIAQFRYLERLLVVHGHWCYKRIAQMVCYFFYKNIAFGLTLFYFETHAGYSGQSIYNDWYMTMFNVIVTSMPVVSLGLFEQDVSSDVCLEFPTLYQQGAKNVFFGWYRILGWMANALYTSLCVFYLNVGIFDLGIFREDGKTVDMGILGTTMFTCVVCAVNIQIALIISHYTWIQPLLIYGSILLWYIVIYIYGMLPPDFSANAYQIFVEALAPSGVFWVSTILVSSVSCFLYLTYMCFMRTFYPEDHHVIQEIQVYRKNVDVEGERLWRREQSKAKQETKIGFTARVDAKIRRMKEKLQKKNMKTSSSTKSTSSTNTSTST